MAVNTNVNLGLAIPLIEHASWNHRGLVAGLDRSITPTSGESPIGLGAAQGVYLQGVSGSGGGQHSSICSFNARSRLRSSAMKVSATLCNALMVSA